MILRCLAFLSFVLLTACGEPLETLDPEADPPRILLMGDSMLAWNRGVYAEVAGAMEEQLDEEVLDRSVLGAQIVYALPISGALGRRISNQYIEGDWDWIVMNGGGNDLLLGCGCAVCDGRMQRMISEDGSTGDIPKLVSDIRGKGAKVLYLGYLRTPGRVSPIESCTEVGTTLENRLEKMAARDRGVYFMPLDGLVPPNDLSFHDVDRIHPSRKGSAAIAEKVAAFIKARER